MGESLVVRDFIIDAHTTASIEVDTTVFVTLFALSARCAPPRQSDECDRRRRAQHVMVPAAETR